MTLAWILSSCALILVVLALRAAAGSRISARLRYALWAVVLVRLLVPVQLFPSPVSGLTLPRLPAAMDQDTVYVMPTVRTPVQDAESVGVYVEDGEILLDTNPAGYSRLEGGGQTVVRYLDRISRKDLLILLWGLGSFAVLITLLSANLRFFRRLRRTRRPLGTGRSFPGIYVAEGLPSPCLFGLFRPAVYVTEEAAGDGTVLRHVLAHECTHYRHLDHIWSFLRCVALAIHWWNPLVWLAVILSRRDGDLACDEGALRRLGDGERTAYGKTLLTLTTAKPQPGDLLSCATTMTGGKRSLRERIRRIASHPKQLAGAAAAAACVMLLAAACAFGRVEPAPPATLEELLEGVRAEDISEIADASDLTAEELAQALGQAAGHTVSGKEGEDIFCGELEIRLSSGDALRVQPARKKYMLRVTRETADTADTLYLEDQPLHTLVMETSENCLQYASDHPDILDDALQDYLRQLTAEDIAGHDALLPLKEEELARLLNRAAGHQVSRTYQYDSEIADEVGLTTVTLSMWDDSKLLLVVCMEESVYICHQTEHSALAGFFNFPELRWMLFRQRDLSETPLLETLFAAVQAENVTYLDAGPDAAAQSLADALNQASKTFSVSQGGVRDVTGWRQATIGLRIPEWSTTQDQLVALDTWNAENLIQVSCSGYQMEVIVSEDASPGGTYIRDIPYSYTGLIEDPGLYQWIRRYGRDPMDRAS